LLHLLILGVSISMARADITKTKDKETGWDIYTITQGDTKAQLAPSAGCNVFSIEYKGQEILRKPKSLNDLPGFMYGVPVLYPTPNRVKNSEFTFGGHTYKFKANDGPNFLHGIVHSVPWEVTQVCPADDRSSVHCQLAFKERTERYGLFPHKHVLGLTVTVKNSSVRLTYTVDNTEGGKPLPFGFALHPWFIYLGERKSTYLKVPADNLMFADEAHLPNGGLVRVSRTKYDTRRPKTLEGFVIDDVYFGMRASAPAAFEHREQKLTVTCKASRDFTHLVVYTPEEPWFCVENQTCSTDAHNLHSSGSTKESHLMVLPAGKTHTGYVEYRLKKGK